MRIPLIVAIAAGLATSATATPTKHHHRAPDSGAATVRALNEKSLQQAPAAAMTASPPMAPAVPEPNAAATDTAPPQPEAAPTPPAPPQ